MSTTAMLLLYAIIDRQVEVYFSCDVIQVKKYPSTLIESACYAITGNQFDRVAKPKQHDEVYF